MVSGPPMPGKRCSSRTRWRYAIGCNASGNGVFEPAAPHSRSPPINRPIRLRRFVFGIPEISPRRYARRTAPAPLDAGGFYIDAMWVHHGIRGACVTIRSCSRRPGQERQYRRRECRIRLHICRRALLALPGRSGLRDASRYERSPGMSNEFGHPGRHHRMNAVVSPDHHRLCSGGFRPPGIPRPC